MRYAHVARLGRGGMGVVDLARDEAGALVALKRVPLHGSPAEAAAARRRIRREAEVLQSLDHPAIVRLLDVVDDGDDVVLVMPHLSGGTLASRLTEGGPLEPTTVAALAGPLLGALAAAHRQGVVHRDIKPSNVLFDSDGRPHLADFGAASSRDVTAGLTEVGTVIGTPEFMAPEQARGEVAGPPADVFALGATLRYALTGSGPWGADGALAFHRAVVGRTERVPRGIAPPALRRTIEAMCQPDPARRPTAAALAGGPAGTAVAGPVGADGRHVRRLSHRAPHRLRRRTAWAAAGGAAAMSLLGALGLASLGDGGVADATPGGSEVPDVLPCQPLAYQPCGGPTAPGTDGHRCVDDRGDYDGDPENGCEAIPDTLDGSVLAEAVVANLVPAGDTDTYAVPVRDRAQLLCDGTVTVTLTAPAGVAQRLEIVADGEVLERAGSADGTPASVALDEPSCFRDDSTDLEARITSIGADRTVEPYRLEVSGSY